MTHYDGPPSQRVLVPFELFHDPMERLLIVDFKDDSDYTGIELQAFDDAVKGHGIAVLLYRADGKLDWYMTPGLTLDREAAAVGAGLGEWQIQDFINRLEIGEHGVDAEVRLTLHDGREVEMVVTEHRPDRGRSIDLLAPLGVGIEKPVFLPYFTMFGIDLVRRGGSDVALRIGGEHRALESIPVPIPYSGRFSYLARYSDDPFIIRINPATDGPVRMVDPDVPASDGQDLTFTRNEGHAELSHLSIMAAGHEAWLTLEPALPDLDALADGASIEGRFGVGADDAEMIAGDYSMRRSGGSVALAMQPTEPWHPQGGPLVWLTIRMFPGFFRTWTTTYRWSADVRLGDEPSMTSAWERTGG